ncbi:hypothetical protein [Tsukamurella sp. 1534]|uniref:hypothetical protein n=1 Tax=Tsukamurella sp. 1534 TaxID=1151061 RepID=UPI0002DE45E4|nr:hypothetical protein [Tsukamurella sp. 1534]
MIATLVAPILWFGALERLGRWQSHRNAPATAGLVTAVALALMLTLDTPLVREAFVGAGLTVSEVITIERILLLVACFGALVFALALDGRLTPVRAAVRAVPLLFAGVVVVVNTVLTRFDPSTADDVLQLAVENALVYSCLAATALGVALSSWRASQRTRVHRVQLQVLALGGIVLAVVAVANVIAGGFLLQQLQVSVWVLRVNRAMLGAAFAGWTLVLMASWLGSALIASREWLDFRPAFEQVHELFPDLEPVLRPGGGWVETADARAIVLLDGWAMLARPGEALHADESPADRARAVAQWLDQTAPYSSISSADLAPPPGWRAARWTSAVTKRAQHTPSPLLERVR